MARTPVEQQQKSQQEEASELPWSSSQSQSQSHPKPGDTAAAHPGHQQQQQRSSTYPPVVPLALPAASSSSAKSKSPQQQSTSSNNGSNGTETAMSNGQSSSASLQYTDSISLTTRPASFAGAPAGVSGSRFRGDLQQQLMHQHQHQQQQQQGPHQGIHNARSLNHGYGERQYHYEGNGSTSTNNRQSQAHSPYAQNRAGPASTNTYTSYDQQPYTQGGGSSNADPRLDRGEGTSAQARASSSATDMDRRRGESNSSSGSDSQPLSQLLPSSSSRMHPSRSRRSRSAERQIGGTSGPEIDERRSPKTNASNTASRTDSLLPPATRTGSRESGHLKGSSVGSNGSSSSGNSRGHQISQSRSGESRSRQTQQCAKCGLAMTGQFVRALGTVFHLDCFRCQDCNKVVAAKFFPVDGPGGRQYPLCETDYFRRLSLICAKCGAALRGSYITALDMKFHVEHFTCSVCPIVFGPQDSYYEHAGQVYCHFHYSTRFAVKCTGCKTAILKQFVEINRNNVDEHWHPECYMIHKFWNIKLVPSSRKTIKASPTTQDDPSAGAVELDVSSPATPAEDWATQEQNDTAQTLRDRQKHVETQVYRIWTVLSTFEESSAACISEMLRHVSNGNYLDGVQMAERFVLHVETLFAAIDDLNAAFRHIGGKEMPHVREARMLCKKVVNFFSLLSHTHETGARKMGITQELLSLVTGLAHYLKILIRIALTAALKLERDHQTKSSLNHFLGRLDRLCKDSDALKTSSSPTIVSPEGSRTELITKSRQYGYKSLARPSLALINQGESISDLCEVCRHTVEEECVRFGPNMRWHLHCLSCSACYRYASKERNPSGDEGGKALYLKEFRMETSDATQGIQDRGARIFCSECPSGSIQEGFEFVTRLEQYAFLLCVALNKLFRLLKQRGIVAPIPSEQPASSALTAGDDRSIHEAYRDSNEIKRMKTVNLDRKISTNAKLAQRLTVIESPSGRSAQGNDNIPPQISPPENRDITSIEQPGARQHPNGMVQMPGVQQTEQPMRPNYNRTMTAIRVVEEQPIMAQAAFSGGLGSEGSPIRHEDGITLADLHQVMEAEQAREQGGTIARNHQLLSELSALEYFIVKHAAAIALASDLTPLGEVAQLDDLLDIIDAKKNNFWGKLFKGANKDKKEIKKKGVFGVPLEVLVEKHGTDSMLGTGPGSVRIPTFLDDAITALKQMDLSVEGIFRKNGNIRRLNLLTEAIDRDPESVNLADDNPVQIAALLKKFLRDLPDPLLTFRLQHLWLATQNIENDRDRRKALHLVCCLMPKHHRDAMEVLFVFLKWVASFSHIDEETGNMMDIENLAKVICPSILHSKGKDPSKDESMLSIRTITELLEYQDQFFTVPEELLAILSDQELFANPSELSSKDILKKAELYMRERQRSRGSGSHKIRPPHRGEIKQTHPHFHAGAFSPPATQYQYNPMFSPSNDRPLSWQNPLQQSQQQSLLRTYAQQQPDQSMNLGSSGPQRSQYPQQHQEQSLTQHRQSYQPPSHEQSHQQQSHQQHAAAGVQAYQRQP